MLGARPASWELSGTPANMKRMEIKVRCNHQPGWKPGGGGDTVLTIRRTAEGLTLETPKRGRGGNFGAPDNFPWIQECYRCRRLFSFHDWKLPGAKPVGLGVYARVISRRTRS